MATLAQMHDIWASLGGPTPARFLAACLVAAYNVKNEDPGTANHANRLIWANAILSGDTATVESKAREHVRYAIASNATFQSVGESVTDNDIQYIVNSQINTFATGS